MKICIVSSVAGHDAELTRVCEGLQMYDQQFCNQPVDPFSGESFVPAQIRVLAQGEPVPTDEIPYHIDATTGVDGAAAYHDKYGDGRPYAIAGLDAAKNGEWLCADGDSVLALLEHEHAELRGNPKVNRWVQSNFLDKATGRTYPLVCPERCLAGDTEVRLANGSLKTISELCATPSFSVCSVDERGNAVIGNGFNARRTQANADVVCVALSDGSFVRCTPDHRFLMSDGSYQEAQTLRNGDRLFQAAPAEASANLVNRGLIDSEALSEIGNPFIRTADVSDFIRGVPMLPVSGQSILRRRIKHVRVVRSQKQMRRIHTRSVVAGVADLHVFGNVGFVVHHPRKTVSTDRHLLFSNLAVAIGSECTSPLPTSRRSLRHTRPKSFLESGRPLAVNLIPWTGLNRAVLTQSLQMGRTETSRPTRTRTFRNTASLHDRVVHSVQSDGKADVYDLTVEKHHNFELASGIVVHNCDPFQGVYDKMKLSDGTMVDRVAFAYLAFFDRDRIQSEQLDSHGAASEPLVILPGGYQIVASIGRESQVFGMRSTKAGRVDVCEHHVVKMTAATRARKLSPVSRTMRIVNSLMAA